MLIRNIWQFRISLTFCRPYRARFFYRVLILVINFDIFKWNWSIHSIFSANSENYKDKCTIELNIHETAETINTNPNSATIENFLITPNLRPIEKRYCITKFDSNAFTKVLFVQLRVASCRSAPQNNVHFEFGVHTGCRIFNCYQFEILNSEQSKIKLFQELYFDLNK